jgi:hypothetical protein
MAHLFLPSQAHPCAPAHSVPNLRLGASKSNVLSNSFENNPGFSTNLRDLYIVELVRANDEMMFGEFVSKGGLLMGVGVMEIEMRGDA